MSSTRKDSGSSARGSGGRRESMAPGRRKSRTRDDPSYETFWANFNYVDVGTGGHGTVGDKVYGHALAKRKRRQSTIRRPQVSAPRPPLLPSFPPR